MIPFVKSDKAPITDAKMQEIYEKLKTHYTDLRFDCYCSDDNILSVNL